jgi:CBS domain containing-hemolysin-like protein
VVLLALSSFQILEIEIAETTLRLAMLFTLTLAIAFFVAAELSLVAASPQQIQQLAQQTEDPGKARTAQLVQQAQNNLQQYLSVTQTGTTAGSLLLGWLGEGATVHWIEPWISWLPIGKLPAMLTAHSISVIVAFLCVTYVEILLGELIPKVLAANAPERTALLFIRPLQICSYLFWPLLVLLNSNVRLLTGWLTHPKALPELTVAGSSLVQTDSHSIRLSGVAELATLNQEFGLNLPTNTAYQTIAGFMIHQLGRVPTQNERIVWGELELEATSVVDGNLETVLLRQVTRPLLGHSAEAVLLNK